MTKPWKAAVRATSIAVAALVLAGCSSGSSQNDAAARATASPPAASASSTGDQRACLGSEALVKHLAAVTAGWSPGLHPFDPAVDQQIRTFAHDLATQAQFADTRRLQGVVRGNAAAFDDLAEAMADRKRAKVISSVEGTRVAYRLLKSACSFG